MLLDIVEIVAGALVLLVGGAIATVMLARRWALRIERATWREEHEKRRSG